MARKNIHSFASGEVDERFLYRTDFARYFSSCKTLQNYFVQASGGAEFRPGTKYINTVKDSAATTYLVPFIFSTSIAYQLEVGNLYFRFYRDDGVLGAPYELVTPYTTAQLSALKFTQSADVVYITHPNHKPRKLSREADTSWTLSEEEFLNGPFLQLNTDETITITPGYNVWATSTTYAANDVVRINGTAVNPPAVANIDNLGTANNVGGGLVGIPITAHPFQTGQTVTISGTTSYDGTYVIQASSTNEIQITVTHAAETFSSSDTVSPAAADKGAGLVGIPTDTNTFTAGQLVVVAGTTEYNGTYELHESSTAYEVVIIDTYVAETFTAADTVTPATFYKSKTDHTSGGGNPTPPGNTTDWAEALTFTGSNIILTASSAVFSSDHVGALWKVIHPRKTTGASGSLAAVGVSDWIRVSKNTTWALLTGGTWVGLLELQRTFDDGTTVETIKTYRSQVNVTGEELDNDALYRVALTERTSGTVIYDLNVDEYETVGIVKITGYTSTTEVPGTVKSAVGNVVATKNWAEGAWSDDTDRGWPCCATFYDNRLVYGGSPGQETTITASKSDDFNNFDAGTLDDDSIIRALNGDQVNKVQWMFGEDLIVIATAGGVWWMGANNLSNPMSPTNVTHRRQNADGAADVQPVESSDSLLYIAFGGTKVYELIFDGAQERYRSLDLTRLAGHFSDTYGFDQIAFIKQPEPMIVVRRTDGVLLTAAYNRNEELIGWSRFVTDGVVESISVIPQGMEDHLWMIIKRTINGSTSRYVERMLTRKVASDSTSHWFLDSGLETDGGASVSIQNASVSAPVIITSSTHGLSTGDKVRIRDIVGTTEANGVWEIVKLSASSYSLKDPDTGTAIDGTGFTAYVSGGTGEKVSKTYTGLSHLEGKTINVLADGMPEYSLTVASGQITLDDYANRVIAGLPYQGVLQPSRPDFEGGPISGSRRSIKKMVLALYKTNALKYGDSLTSLFEANFLDIESILDNPLALYSGLLTIDLDGDWTRDSDIFLVQDAPLPQTILGMAFEMDVGDL